MTQKSRLVAPILTLLFLAACGGAAQPNYSLNPQTDDSDKAPLPNPGLDETQPGNPEVWPSTLKNILMVCEIPQSVGKRAAAIAWTTTAATDRAGFRLARFPMGDTNVVPEDIRRPEITSTANDRSAFDLVFEGLLNVGPKGGLMDMRQHLFVGWVTATRSGATVWARLSEYRLDNYPNKMASLPHFVRLSHTLRVNDTNWVMPVEKTASFDLFEKSYDSGEFKRLNALGPKLSDSFPLATLKDGIVFQQYVSSSWRLLVLDNLKGKVARRAVNSSARYLADTEDSSLWAWSAKSSKEWNLSRYSLRSGSFSVDSSAPVLKLAQPTLARRFDVLVKGSNVSEDIRETGWIVARDDLAKLQIYSDDFELESELDYPRGAISALNAQSVGDNSAIFSVEFNYGPGQYRATLVHALRTELRGPLGQSYCARPSL